MSQEPTRWKKVSSFPSVVRSGEINLEAIQIQLARVLAREGAGGKGEGPGQKGGGRGLMHSAVSAPRRGRFTMM